ncbi:DUF6392 family protein [Pseudomonas sp. RT6P73]
MTAINLERWIKSLGDSYDFLVAQGTIADGPLQALYANSGTLEIEPTPGIELIFGAETKRFNAIQIILQGDIENGVEAYSGPLPAPYSAAKNQLLVRALLGPPLRSVGSFDVPNSVKTIGGWDSYRLPSTLHPGAVADFQYAEDFRVDRIVFALIDPD